MAACTHSFRAIRPGNRPVHHPGDASLLTSLCQHDSNRLTRYHAICGGQLLLQRPLLGRTGEHRDRRAAGEHFCCHMVLGARKHQPEKDQRQEWFKQKAKAGVTGGIQREEKIYMGY